MKHIRTIQALITLGFLVTGSAVFADENSNNAMSAKGKALLEANCGACHSVGTDGESPHKDAPPFRTLGQSYPVAYLAEALAEGIMTGHPDMPIFSFEAQEVDQIITWLETIQTQ